MISFLLFLKFMRWYCTTCYRVPWDHRLAKIRIAQFECNVSCQFYKIIVSLFHKLSSLHKFLVYIESTIWSMASKQIPTPFISLPNELIYHIFKYLSATDLIESFGYLPNDHLQQLFASHMYMVDLKLTDVKSLAWLNQYRAVVQRHVKSITVDIELAEKVLHTIPKLDALTINYDDETQYVVDQLIARFQTVPDVQVGSLTLYTYAGGVNTTTSHLLLGGNGHLPEHTLNVSNCRLALDIHCLPSHSQLRHLNCILQEEALLHALLARLPNLETIKTGLISNGLERESNTWENVSFLGVSVETDADSETENRVVLSRYKPKTDASNITVVAPPHLRSISITGHIANFDLLNQLFQLGRQSLKTIKLNIFAYSIIDPEQVDRVDNHINFDFRISYQLFQLPADFDWNLYIGAFAHRPVLRCEKEVLCCLTSIIDKTVFWLQTPKMFVTPPKILCFPQVHTLLFQYCSFTIDTNTAKFIQETFPCMYILIWRLRSPRVTSLISLDMVTTLVVHSEDRQTLQGLFLLCPNVTRLYFTKAFQQAEKLPELNEERMHNACEQIKQVQLVMEEKVDHPSIKKLFPSAQVTYDANPFYEKMFWTYVFCVDRFHGKTTHCKRLKKIDWLTFSDNLRWLFSITNKYLLRKNLKTALLVFVFLLSKRYCT